LYNTNARADLRFLLFWSIFANQKAEEQRLFSGLLV
jgi:hypothetical protein